jgi:hypothetical protein
MYRCNASCGALSPALPCGAGRHRGGATCRPSPRRHCRQARAGASGLDNVDGRILLHRPARAARAAAHDAMRAARRDEDTGVDGLVAGRFGVEDEETGGGRGEDDDNAVVGSSVAYVGLGPRGRCGGATSPVATLPII